MFTPPVTQEITEAQHVETTIEDTESQDVGRIGEVNDVEQ